MKIPMSYLVFLGGAQICLIILSILIVLGNACAPPPLRNMGVCSGTFTKDDNSNEAYAFWDTGALGSSSAPDPTVKNWYYVRGHCQPAGVNK